MYYAIVFGGIAYDIATDRWYIIPFALAVLAITAGWHLDYARLLSLQEERKGLEEKIKQNKLKFIKVLDVEKVRYSNVRSQVEILQKENDELKLTIHNLGEEKASLKKKLYAVKKRTNYKKIQ